MVAKFILLAITFGLLQGGKSQMICAAAKIGTTTGSTVHTKKNFACGGPFISYEKLTKDTSFGLLVSIGHPTISFDYYDASLNSIYNTRSFIDISTQFQKIIRTSYTGKTWVVLGAGIGVSWCYNDKKEIRSNLEIRNLTLRNTGFNGYILVDAGLSFYINRYSRISTTVQPQFDVFTSYRQKVNEIKMVKSLFNLSYSFYINML